MTYLLMHRDSVNVLAEEEDLAAIREVVAAELMGGGDLGLWELYTAADEPAEITFRVAAGRSELLAFLSPIEIEDGFVVGLSSHQVDITEPRTQPAGRNSNQLVRVLVA